MFKESVFDKFIEILNLNTQTIQNNNDTIPLHFEGGFDIATISHNGNVIPSVVNTSAFSMFDYTVEEYIPVSQQLAQETPDTNDSDRSDYIFQYKFMCRLDTLEAMKAALVEARDYLVANRQFTIDGYEISFKPTRASKQSAFHLEGGNIYFYYTMSLYATAVKTGLGYIVKDTDKWEMKEFGTGTYVKLKRIGEESVSITKNVEASNASTSIKFRGTSRNISGKFQMAYDSSTFAKLVYADLMGQTDINQKYDLRITFDSIAYTYVVMIPSGARTWATNGQAILQFDVVES